MSLDFKSPSEIVTEEEFVSIWNPLVIRSNELKNQWGQQYIDERKQINQYLQVMKQRRIELVSDRRRKERAAKAQINREKRAKFHAAYPEFKQTVLKFNIDITNAKEQIKLLRPQKDSYLHLILLKQLQQLENEKEKIIHDFYGTCIHKFVQTPGTSPHENAYTCTVCEYKYKEDPAGN